MNKNIPEFKFAVREDLVGNKINFLPTKAEPMSTGWDVKSAKTISFYKGSYVKIPLGFRALPPEGWWFELKPRSSTFAKKELHCLYGTIDESFEGELLLACQYLPSELKDDTSIIINFGDAIGQIIPVKRQEMIVTSITNDEYDRLCKVRNYSRGIGGFGSTS